MFAIAIDGPAGAGKSSAARAAAKKLGFIYVDTGALYRTVGLYMLRQGISLEEKEKIVENLPGAVIELRFLSGEQHVFLCGEDVSGEIRTPQVSMAASAVSAIPEVRRFLFDLQLSLAEKNNVLMDGRDIGSVVFPDADVKFFLTASSEVRAERRYRELLAKGETVTFDEVRANVEKRDYIDEHRAVSPLRKVPDAVEIDNGNLTIDEEVREMAAIIMRKYESRD